MSIRLYPIEGKNYPSVTSILSFVFGIGEHLNRWSVKKGAEAIVQALEDARLTGEELSEKDLYYLAERARHQILDQARIKGNVVHSFAENTLKQERIDYVDPQYQPYVRAFLRFLEDHDIAPLKQEERVYNDVYEYAGRFDCYAYVTCRESCRQKANPQHRHLHSTPTLLDFKTSNSLRHEYGLQLAAYKKCLVDKGYPVDSTCLLHLRESGRYTLKETNEDFISFANVLPVFRWKLDKERSQVQFEYATDESAATKEVNENAPTSEDIEAFDNATLITEEARPQRPEEQELSPSTVEGLLQAQGEATAPVQTTPTPLQPVRKRGRPRKVRPQESPAPAAPGLSKVQERQRREEAELDPAVLAPFLTDKPRRVRHA